MAAIKVYGLPGSTSTARVLTCLEEKGVPYELIRIDFPAGEHKRPPFLDKNPLGKIPALQDGDLTIFESRAICKYIARKYHGQGPDLLRLENLTESTMVDVWMEVEGQSYNPAVAGLVVEMVLAPLLFGRKPNEKVIEDSAAALGQVLDVYEKRLSKYKYLAGDFYSLADMNHFPFTCYLMNTSKAHLINDRPRVKGWWERVASRPALKKVAAGLTPGA